MSYTVPELYRQRYGLGFELLASSNECSPACLPAFAPWRRKKIFTASNPEFAAVFETKISSVIDFALCALLPKHRWALNVFRMGYEVEKLKNPLVIHLVFSGILDTSMGSTFGIKEAEALAESELKANASEIVAMIMAAIANSGWKGEEVRVDVCRSAQDFLISSNAYNSGGVDLLENVFDLYAYQAPLPGFSIGPRARDSAGTLTGYIRHVSGNESQIFAITCRHVVSNVYLGNSAYLHKDGLPKHLVKSPAFMDHLAVGEAILNRIKDNQNDINSCINKLKNNPSLSTKASTALEFQKECSQATINLWKMARLDAADYDTRFGHVYATSDTDQNNSRGIWEGSLDWALISVPDHKQTQNKHIPWNVRDRGSGFPWNWLVKGLDERFIEQAKEYFKDGPNFKPVGVQALAEGQLVYKPTSRKTGWVVGEFNGIKSLLRVNGTRTTKEWSVMALDVDGNFHGHGDSGAIILDQYFHPIAMLWGGMDYGCCSGALAFVTPIDKVLRDIERCLGWEVGSAAFY